MGFKLFVENQLFCSGSRTEFFSRRCSAWSAWSFLMGNTQDSMSRRWLLKEEWIGEITTLKMVSERKEVSPSSLPYWLNIFVSLSFKIKTWMQYMMQFGKKKCSAVPVPLTVSALTPQTNICKSLVLSTCFSFFVSPSRSFTL